MKSADTDDADDAGDTGDAGGGGGEDWNYFAHDAQYPDVLKARLADGVEMDSARALGGYLDKHCSGDLRVIDFGAGPGHYYPVLKRLYRGGALRYLGVDIDERNVRHGTEHFAGDADCRIIAGSVLEPAAALALAAPGGGDDVNGVNCVVSANTLPHVPSIVPLLQWLASPAASAVRWFCFRMLVGSECVQIKKHLREREFDGMFQRGFQYNNIYSVPFLEHHVGLGWRLIVEPDVVDAQRLQQHRIPAQSQDEFYGNRVSRPVGGLVFKGEIYMPWKFVVGVRAS